MANHPRPEQILEFPCTYVFKAFGPNDGSGNFQRAVRAAIARVVPVNLDAMKERASSQGTYICVSVWVRLWDLDQLIRIYAELRQIEDLKYLL